MPPSSSPAASILKSAKPAVDTTAATTTAGKKRKMEEMDLSSSPPSSPVSDAGSRDGPAPKKRARVQFESDVEMRHLPTAADGDENEKSAAVVREEVRRAIQRHVSGTDSEAYDRIKEIFSIDPKKAEEDGSYDVPTHTTLKRHLMGLLSNVAMLDRNCLGLVNAVLGSEWLGRDESYVKLFVRFLGNLAAAQGGYLRSVLKMLVGYFGEVPKGTGKLPGYPPVRNSEIYARTHMALRYVMQLIPAGSGTLSPILSGQFPFDTDSAKANVAYTRNLIKIIEYAPELQSDILALITEKLVKIDVQIQVDMEDFEDEVGEDLLEELSRPVDPTGTEDEDESDSESVASDDESVDAETRRLKVVRDNIRKLDSMIDTLFEFYAPPFTSGTLDEKENALDLLLSHFQSIILPTYRSRHSQFLLFHFSQSSPILVDRFAATCIQIIFSKVQPAIIRQSAAAYLASFVARGAHVSSEVVRDVFDLLGSHLNNLRIEYEATCRGPDLRRYGPFYSTAQALLYIFCFRWRDLTTAAAEEGGVANDEDLDPEDVTFPPSIKELLHRAIYSKLNPLKVCSPAIVSEFARIAHHLRFLYVFPLLETNKRLRVSSFRSLTALSDPRFSQVERESRAGDDGGYQLDAYFPFDPYQLPRSRRWLEGDYVEWRGIPGVDDRDDDDSDSAVEDEEEEEEDGDEEPTASDEE
ncbi:RNA polymerase I specific transcription initiation factor RRN3 superfamily [Rasamsonia emersonii CBS 393.64]|uniref:RNA polymerase I specific transcription initiation factor RRN3 superfamily n=1 Tax=Rasamsonia emersonii (strain ATCC 16479 / CBS 393.64 / IMI 116815) TaxID=1408163 RepID=A0A0F4YK57_RASE3|nr:RNA polymerase I specific transcription initiation factor RRN3 superfamily [Rasamsonia emersonii CBS 393.64]KKA18246.1 RNA polymerase I specific transcription initiation factor RRN3 superfamily [Rasamsonia emersonii CBS 393.64]